MPPKVVDGADFMVEKDEKLNDWVQEQLQNELQELIYLLSLSSLFAGPR